MKIEEGIYKAKCDIPGCRNVSNFIITGKHGILSANMYICKECAQELYKNIGKCIIPKSPKNILNKSN